MDGSEGRRGDSPMERSVDGEKTWRRRESPTEWRVDGEKKWRRRDGGEETEEKKTTPRRGEWMERREGGGEAEILR